MKKISLICFFLLINFIVHAQVTSDAQIIKTGHWIYDDLSTLASESKTGIFSTNTPVTAGELKLYFKNFERESLSDSGKIVYDRIENFLYTKKNIFPNKYFMTDIGLRIAPELCYKSNPQIDWTYNYYYKNNPLSSDVRLSISEYFSLG